MPWRTPGMPLVTAAPPAASTPTSRAVVSTNPAKVPAAFEPPPTQATTTSGSAAVEQLPALASGLVADDPLELADHVREGVGPHHRSQAVVRAVHRRHPVPQRLVDGVLEGAAARAHRSDLGAQQLHAEDVQLLARDVDLAHVDGALQAEQRGGGGGGHPVLAGPGLGDHPRSCPCAWSAAPGRSRCSTCASRCGRGPRASSSTRTPELLGQPVALGDRGRAGRRSRGGGRRARRGRPGRPRPRRTPAPAPGRRARGTRGRSARRTRRTGRRAPVRPITLIRRHPSIQS